MLTTLGALLSQSSDTETTLLRWRLLPCGTSSPKSSSSTLHQLSHRHALTIYMYLCAALVHSSRCPHCSCKALSLLHIFAFRGTTILQLLLFYGPLSCRCCDLPATHSEALTNTLWRIHITGIMCIETLLCFGCKTGKLHTLEVFSLAEVLDHKLGTACQVVCCICTTDYKRQQ